MPVTSYIRKQATIAAIVNVVINGLLAWLGHRDTESVPLGGSNGIMVDVAVTSVVLSLLVSLFMTRRVRQDRSRLGTMGRFPPAPGWLSHLPAGAGSLGLLLGVGVAIVVTVALGLLDALGLSSPSLAAYVAFKAVYGGLLGFVVTRWVILRQLLKVSPAS